MRLMRIPNLCTAALKIISEIRILLIREILKSMLVCNLLLLPITAYFSSLTRCQLSHRLPLLEVPSGEQQPQYDQEYVEQDIKTEMSYEAFLVPRSIGLLKDLVTRLVAD